jgi:hypothetical protein
MNYTSVCPQHSSAHSDNALTLSGCALSVVQAPLLGCADTLLLTHAHISPQGDKQSEKHSPAVQTIPKQKTFDNATVARLTDLVALRDMPQRDACSMRPPSRPGRRAPKLTVMGQGVDSSSDLGNCEIWIDGSLMKVSKPVGHRAQVGGGLRGQVHGFSKASRRRLMQKIAQLRQDARPLFLTLTYPGEFPLEAAHWKRDFDKWCKRLHRKYPAAGLVWRLEPQKRGAPHFHVLLYGVKLAVDFREWLRLSWYECVNSGDTKHYYRGTDVEAVRSHRGVRSYAGKYLAKVQAPPQQVDCDGEILPMPDWSAVGRWWGVRYGENLPFSDVVGGRGLSFVEAARLMRYLRRYLKGQGKRVNGSMPGMTVFVNTPRQWFDNLDRLIC